MRTANSLHLLAILLVGTAALGAKAMDGPVSQSGLDPIPVSLDLDDKDKDSKALSDAIADAVRNDPRFTLVTRVPPLGLKMVMDDGVKPEDDDSRHIEAYEVDFKSGSGKYVGASSGYCDRDKVAMCGRVVVQDSFDAYQAYIAKLHKS